MGQVRKRTFFAWYPVWIGRFPFYKWHWLKKVTVIEEFFLLNKRKKPKWVILKFE